MDLIVADGSLADLDGGQEDIQHPRACGTPREDDPENQPISK